MASRKATDLATERVSSLGHRVADPSVGVASRLRLNRWRSLICDRLDSGDPLPIKVAGVPPHGLIPVSLCVMHF